MVVEIPYAKYKEFCSKLSSKDIFYYLRNVFVKFPYDDTIYAVKYKIGGKPHKIYDSLLRNKKITEVHITSITENTLQAENRVLGTSNYKGKSVLILL